ncbi:MAG: polysaccharide deacetylase family protein [Thermodesulfovibrionales bacterium]|nr:polysaccharide deacetylase family protein [Thermodesulfovibrionales bacterium]
MSVKSFYFSSMGIVNKRGVRGIRFLLAFLLFLMHFISPLPVYPEENHGGIVIAFDDGYPSWINIIAPELSHVGGVATGFVNNQRINFGDLSFEDLRTLQNRYGWEIGTHTYHHFNAPSYIKQKGLPAWVSSELEDSVKELNAKGLKIQSIVFPYNAYSKELAKEVIKRFSSFRRDEVFAADDSIGRDGSIPGTDFDISFYVPLPQIFQWIDFVREQNKLLFLYGHKVLPDEEFFTGTVQSLSARSLVSDRNVELPSRNDFCLVPDIRRRVYMPVKVENIKGDTITVFQDDLSKMSETQASFIIGPCYGIQLSYFRKVISYAAEKLPFYTVSQAVQLMKKSQTRETEEKKIETLPDR